MKKILLLLLALTLTLCVLASCGGDKNPPTDDNGGNTQVPPTDDNGGNTQVPPTKYTVTWKSEDGTTLKTEEVEEGKTPAYTYTKEDMRSYMIQLMKISSL